VDDGRTFLVVNADDLGMCGAVNRGIVRCFEAGSVTQASLMMPCPAAAEGARLAAKLALPAAVHLTLASEWDRIRWGPLTTGGSLVTEDGTFPRDVESLKAQADPGDVLAELEAQVEAFLAAGLEPVALDSHMYLYDEDVMASLVRRYGVRSRDPLAHHPDSAFPYSSVFRMSPLHPDLKLRALCNYARNLAPGVHLVICHPAEDDPELDEAVVPESGRWLRTWARGIRISDLETLLDPAFVETCRAAGVELVSVDVAPEPPPAPRRALRNLPPHGPNVIGATGGSGTRALAQTVRLAGMFTGARLNESEDAYELGGFSDRWINAFTPYRDSALPPALETAMLDDLAALLESHLRDLDAPRPWGWKEPRSSFLLPFLDRHLAGLRFLHVVRDGRDMALSENQNQVRKHGSVIGLPRPGLVAEPLQSIALWSWLNLETARYGEERLGDRYLRIRFEDLCAAPSEVAERIFDFFELVGDPSVAEERVRPPASTGRWRAADPDLVAELSRIGGEALARFGYGSEVV
jgi:predicted glycoside hydrolase/deacetylase ChbG (UPF0249 family)